MLSLIGFGLAMGLLFAAPPGLVTAETLRRGVARGFPAALGVQLGSLIGDATYCLIALAGVAVLIQNSLAEVALGVASVLFLLYLALNGLRAELAISPQPTSPSRLRDTHHGAFLTGLLLSLTNPWAIGFWLSLGGTLAAYGALESRGTMALFFASFFGACLAYAFLLALLIGATRHALPPRANRWLAIACNLALILLALTVAYRLISLIAHA